MIWEPSLLVTDKLTREQIILLANEQILKERERCAKIVENESYTASSSAVRDGSMAKKIREGN